MLADLLREMGHRVETAASVAQGGAKAAEDSWDLVLVDLRLPDGSGLEILPQVQRLPQPPRVFLILGAGEAAPDSPAFHGGVTGILRRTDSLPETRALVSRALAFREAGSPEVVYFPLRLEEVVGRSAAMRTCYEALARAVGQERPVLILGEDGTGRSLFARTLHLHRAGRHGPFVTVSAGSLAGREGEASSPAASPWPALSRQAQGGTLFLREVEALSPQLQHSLADLLSRRQAGPGRGFRLVAASSRELAPLVRDGLFLRDLWDHFADMVIRLPPLRERREDIPELAFFHLLRLCPPGNLKGLGPDVLEAFLAYPWPGNVAELVAVLTQALKAAGAEPVLRVWHLPSGVRPVRCPLPEAEPTGAPELVPAEVSFKEYRRRVVAQAEKAYMEALMTRTQHNVKEACRLSALSLPRLYALLKKYRLRA
jgi:two-component system NtrC family response regulator